MKWMLESTTIVSVALSNLSSIPSFLTMKNYTHTNTISLICVCVRACKRVHMRMFVYMNSSGTVSHLCKYYYYTEMPIIVANQQTAALDIVIYWVVKNTSYCKCVLLITKRQWLSFLLYLKKLETRSEKNCFFIYMKYMISLKNCFRFFQKNVNYLVSKMQY